MFGFLKTKTALSGLYILFFCANFLQILAMDVEHSESKAIIKIHNVGQGNCVTLEVKDKDGESKYMLVDAGSKAFAREFTLLEEIPQPSTPPRSSSNPSPPRTVKKTVQLPGKLKETKIVKDAREQKKENAQEKIRKTLGETEEKIINIQTIVITHPDEDHYNWLPELIKKDDKVENIILGGLPENYNLDTLEWLKDRLEETNIFFPVIGYTPIKNKEKKIIEVNKLIDQRNKEKNKTQKDLLNQKIKGILIKIIYRLEDQFHFAVQAYSNSEGTIVDNHNQSVGEAFQKVFNFNESVKIYMLSINPLHVSGMHETARLYEGKEDDNKESLVMKIATANSSVILTGDATQTTVKRIIGNYGRDTGFLETDVLLASHHGASTHGSNSQEWLNLTKPKYILISNGLSYGHPSEEAYERFHEPVKENLVKRHNVLVGKAIKGQEQEEGKSYKEGIVHQTKAAIFSTLTSGTITVDFMAEGVKILTEEDENIDLSVEEESKEEDDAVAVVIKEKESIITATPKKKNPRRKDSSGDSKSLSIEEKEPGQLKDEVASDRKKLRKFLKYLREERKPLAYSAKKVSRDIKSEIEITPQDLDKIIDDPNLEDGTNYKKLWKALKRNFNDDFQVFEGKNSSSSNSISNEISSSDNFLISRENELKLSQKNKIEEEENYISKKRNFEGKTEKEPKRIKKEVIYNRKYLNIFLKYLKEKHGNDKKGESGSTVIAERIKRKYNISATLLTEISRGYESRNLDNLWEVLKEEFEEDFNSEDFQKIMANAQ